MDDRRNNPLPDDQRLFINNKTMFPMGINDPKFDKITKFFTFKKLNTFLNKLTSNVGKYTRSFFYTFIEIGTTRELYRFFDSH